MNVSAAGNLSLCVAQRGTIKGLVQGFPQHGTIFSVDCTTSSPPHHQHPLVDGLAEREEKITHNKLTTIKRCWLQTCHRHATAL